MLKKDAKKGSTVYHKQFGKAEFVAWYDHEAKEYAIIRIPGMPSRITLPRKELSETPRKIPGIKPGWYSAGVATIIHFWVPADATGFYRSACNRAKVAGEVLVPEVKPDARCKRCEISARDVVKTTLFDFEKGK